MYDPQMVQPMRDQLTSVGFQEAPTALAVEEIVNQSPKTALFFVNSICGCAAGTARPGVIDSINNDLKPEVLVTAFAGNDVEGVSAMRDLFLGYAPSSPCVALFRENKLVHIIERHGIEGQSAETISQILKSAYNKYCGEQVDESVSLFDPMGELVLGAETLQALLGGAVKPILLDVREQWEMDQGIIGDAQAVTNELANEIVQNWDREKEIVVYCQHGSRSLQAVQFLRQHGFKKAWSLEGGYAAFTAL